MEKNSPSELKEIEKNNKNDAGDENILEGEVADNGQEDASDESVNQKKRFEKIRELRRKSRRTTHGEW